MSMLSQGSDLKRWLFIIRIYRFCIVRYWRKALSRARSIRIWCVSRVLRTDTAVSASLRLRWSLDKDDVALLAGIPGVGKKTAQKLMLAMRGKLVMDEELIAAPAGNPKFADIVNALSDMGFEYKKALKAVEEVAKNSDIMNMKEDEREKEIFKRAIVLLST